MKESSLQPASWAWIADVTPPPADTVPHGNFRARCAVVTTVLSVSKNKERLFLRRVVLESAGFAVIDATSADEAREKLDHNVNAVLIGHTIGVQDALWIAQQAQAMNIRVCAIRKPISALPKGLSLIDAYVDFMCEPAELIECLRILTRER
jgi:DNA-binding response OmpR family regulator